MNKKSIFSALIGHALERYDVVLYGFFASMLTPIFFPPNPTLALISSLGTFAAGYLMRPLGGIVFGYLGDKYGRKQAFLWSILLVVIPTFCIGILPSYEQIGILAPILLISCRLFQVFCAGGEFSGAAIFIGEHALEKHAGLAGSFVCAVGFMGVALGTAIGTITTSPFFPEWGWRIPFIIGSLLTVWSYYLRKQMKETPDFIDCSSQKMLLQNPLKEILKKEKTNLFYTFSIGATGHIYLYSTTVYMNNVYKNTLHLTHHFIMLIDTSLILLWTIVAFVTGYLSDKIGIKKLMTMSSFLVCSISYPLFFYMDQHISVQRILFVQIVLIIFCAGFFGPATALFKELFPTRQRYSGIAFGITCGQALLGGTTPLINELLVRLTGDYKMPAFYIMFGSLISFISLIALIRKEKLFISSKTIHQNIYLKAS